MFNFAAGPAAIPEPVLARAREELLTRRAHAQSLIESPFGAAPLRRTIEQAHERLRALLDLPENYRVIFMAGGALAQFGLLPLNLLGASRRVAYVDSGYWAGRAIAEARRYATVEVAAAAWRDADGWHLPPPSRWRVPANAAYCHFTGNETADGAEFPPLSAALDRPDAVFACDMTSSFLSRPLDVRPFGMIYAGAQKNIGPAGLSVILVRDDLLRRGAAQTPQAFSYRVQAEAGSCYNTPPIFAVALANLVFEWIADNGGLPGMERASIEKSARLYAAIDGSGGFYHCPVAADSRSRMNVCFALGDDALSERFFAEAEAAGLHNLRGHSRVGGVRASLYNAVPMAAAVALAAFMADFRQRHG